MASNLTARLVLSIRSIGTESLRGVTTELGKVRGAAARLGEAFKGGADLNQFAEGMGRVQSGVTAALREPLDQFSKFEYALARAKSKMDDVSAVDFGRMRTSALAAAQTSAFSATEAADGLGEMAAAGFTVEQQMAALPRVLQLAQAGEVGVGRATAIAASTMSQFGLKAKDIGSIGDTLLAASNASTIGLDEIAESLKYVGPVAAAAGLSLKSTSTFVALLGNAGIEASSAGTALRGMLASMAAPSGKSKKALAELGLGAKDLAKGVEDPIAVLKLLGERFNSKHMSQAQRLGIIMKVFGRETSAAVMSLIEAGTKAGEGGTAFEKMGRAMEGSAGAMQRASDILGETSAQKLKRLGAQVDALKIAAGERLAPSLLQLAADTRPFLGRVGEMIEQHPQAVSAVARVGVAVVILSAGFKAAALSAAFFKTSMALSAVGARAAVAPIVWLGTQVQGLSALLGVNQVIAAGAGQTWRAAALGAGALAVKIAGVAAAAYAGYEAGKLLDSVVGGLVGARGGKLSTEAALSAGESDGINSFVGGAGRFLHIQALQDIAAGNTQRNQDQSLAERTGGQPDQVSQPSQVSPAVPTEQFNAVTGQIEVKVSDDRVRVTTKGRGPLRLGQTPVGAR